VVGILLGGKYNMWYALKENGKIISVKESNNKPSASFFEIVPFLAGEYKVVEVDIVERHLDIVERHGELE